MKRAAVIFALASACSPSELPPTGQVRLFLDTDAILPPAPGETSDEAPMFDRVRIEIFPAGASEPCEGCTRELGLDHAMVFDGRASFGIAPKPYEKGHRVRVRLYRSSGSDVVEPRPTSTLEAVVALPIVEAEGIVDAHVTLMSSDLGTPRGTLEAPIEAELGPSLGGLAGTFASPYRRGCEGAPKEGEACVPGAVFWMGDPSFAAPTERLVVLSPFYVDATEVTVARLRQGGIVTPLVHGPSGTAKLCTFTYGEGSFEDLAVNCVPRDIALAHCAARGATLISEAQWELVASGLRSAPYVWGTDEPACPYAVYARYDFTGKTPSLSTCEALGPFVQPPGTGTRDRLDLPGGTIVDLAGNLAEFVLDDWEEEGEPCWRDRLLYDPVCVSAAHPLSLAIRGSTFTSSISHAAERTFDPVKSLGTAGPQIGFRCARSAEAP